MTTNLLETNKAIKIVADAKIRKAKSGDVHDQPLRLTELNCMNLKFNRKYLHVIFEKLFVLTKLELLKAGFNQNRSKTLRH